MVNAHLARYLNDHLAGSVVVLELLPHLESVYAGTEKECFFAELHTQIEADCQTLQTLMQRLEVAQSPLRQAGAWLAEKVAQLKLRVEDREQGAFYLLESLEIIKVGIEGKQSLWQALAAAVPELQGTDYAALKQRAQEQGERVEAKRIEAAVRAFR